MQMDREPLNSRVAVKLDLLSVFSKDRFAV